LRQRPRVLSPKLLGGMIRKSWSRNWRPSRNENAWFLRDAEAGEKRAGTDGELSRGGLLELVGGCSFEKHGRDKSTPNGQALRAFGWTVHRTGRELRMRLRACLRWRW
jgi:hypothetical protein